ncbi:MAG TPA: alpha/beta hydrolase [Ktedonobacteraceae bacterium]|nr:alpha/beta hydrolase [Ktedonobacteraceae bacterium]
MISILLWSLVGILALLPISGLIYRALCQRRISKTLAIQTPNGITEGLFVTIDKTEQWIQIRGEARTNPILLIVHGHGISLAAFTPLFRSWERHFTIVQWDRRGVGKTMSRNGKAGSDSWTFERLAQDGIEVAEFLCQHLHQNKVILLGLSQGSVIGLLMARHRPDLFQAYIGTGQIVDMLRNETVSYQTVSERARIQHNTRALKALTSIGAPPYQDVRTWLIKQRWGTSTDPESKASQGRFSRMLLFAPDYSLRDVYHAFSDVLFLPQPLYEEYMAFDARSLGTKFELPFFIFQGDFDVQTPTALAEAYFATIEAPTKELVLLKDGGHMALLTRSELFLKNLLSYVHSQAFANHSLLP